MQAGPEGRLVGVTPAHPSEIDALPLECRDLWRSLRSASKGVSLAAVEFERRESAEHGRDLPAFPGCPIPRRLSALRRAGAT